MSEQVGSTMTGDELASLEKSHTQFKSISTIKCEVLRLRSEQLEWWRDAKFGMFIHWGLYAIPAQGEWHLHADKADPVQYAKLADEFAPRHFDGAEWARVAKSTGMQYMVLTARHHDGFALWDSPSSHGNYCSAKTAARRDFVAEYVTACRGAGLRVGLYYSPMDWRFPAYFKPREFPENAALMKAQCDGQVEELMKNYGPIDILWYDGAWLAHTGTDADAAWLWEPLKLNTMVRRYQPNVVISPRSGWEGDFLTDEGSRGVKGPIIDAPWEKCLNLNDVSWGFNTVQKVFSRNEIIPMLVNVVGRGGNMLLNVGPDRDGVIPAAHVERLREVGAWLEKFGKSIFGTRAGPFQPVDEQYCATQRDRTIYVHVLDWKDAETVTLPALTAKIIKCALMSGGELAFNQNDHRTEITVPRGSRQSPDTIVELTLDTKVSSTRTL